MPLPNPHHTSALRCQHCGTPLVLSPDPRLLHIDCPSCGHDNILPPHLVQARQQQYSAALAHSAHELQAAARVTVARTSSWTTLIVLAVLLLSGLLFCGAVSALAWYGSYVEAATEKQREQLQVKAHNTLVARLEAMRVQRGCQRILVQPRSHRGDRAELGLDMIGFDQCVHVVGVTATETPIELSHRGDEALTVALPAAAPTVDYRLCVKKNGNHRFTFATGEAPYSVAAIECPRLPAEGGARSSADDPETSGKRRLEELWRQVTRAGCTMVVTPPTVRSRVQGFTLTSPENSNCFTMLVASHYPDVKISTQLVGPTGNDLPVPPPGPELRIHYCAKKAGKYTLTLTPNTADHYTTVSVDCPRLGPEGLARERQLVAPSR